MPKSCSYGLCKNNSRTSKCRFFVFPSIVLQPDRRRLWAIRCDRRTYDGRTWEPNPDSKYVYVCEYHFVTGEPWNNENHPDYAPSIITRELAATASSTSGTGNVALNRFSRNLARQLSSTGMPTQSRSTHASSCNAAMVESEHSTESGTSVATQVEIDDKHSTIAPLFPSVVDVTAQDWIPIGYQLPTYTPDAELLAASHSMILMDTATDVFKLTGSSCTITPQCLNAPIALTCDQSPVLQSLSFDELKLSSSSLHCRGFVNSLNERYLTFVELTDVINPVVKLSVAIDDKFKSYIHVYGWKVDEDHFLWKQVPTLLNSVDNVHCLLSAVSDLKICSAITDRKLVDLVPNSGIDDAVRHNNCPLYVLDNSLCYTLRAVKCSLLIAAGIRCTSCSTVLKRLMMKRRRSVSNDSVPDVTKSKVNNRFLSSPIKLKKLKLLASRNQFQAKKMSHLQSQIAKYRQTCSSIIVAEGERLNVNDCDTMLQLTNEYKDLIGTEFAQGSFQQILFEQQLKYNGLKSKSTMRWHPAIIRWCLMIKSKSGKAYDGIRSYLNLPSSRTLYDYTHYMEHGLGIHPRVIEQLIAQAKKLKCFTEEHRSFVGILFDEIKIKSDLVYNKSTGDLVGFVSLDKISNDLIQLENTARSGTPQLAEYMLVTMVRGITSNLRYPLSAYASKTASGSSLYNILWECVEYLEVAVGLKVLYLCCDGAIQNRVLFQLHSSEHHAVYKTKNMYAADERDLYFVSDPPHLLKTVRNCFANSFSHAKTRSLWFDGDISWKHVVKLYEEHCETSHFKLCPKLTSSHITLTSFSKMKVSLAAQVLSSTVANALEHVYGDQYETTVKFIRLMDRWFDIMNVKHLYEGKNKRNSNLLPFSDPDDERLHWLENDFLQYCDNWRIAAENRTGQFTRTQRQQMQLSAQTLLGLRITCLSVAGIVRTVLRAGAPFVLTSHINQDPLEQLFGHCRHKGGSNENPNVHEACHAINTIRTISTQSVAIAHGNTEAGVTILDSTPVPKHTSW